MILKIQGKVESNKMRWDCTNPKQGCFNLKMRPKIEKFADLLPGQVSFGDIDAIVELNGKFLVLEWKKHEAKIKTGQAIMFCHMARKDFTVLVILGDPETMEVSSMCEYSDSKFHDWRNCTFDDLCKRISDWVQKVKPECLPAT